MPGILTLAAGPLALDLAPGIGGSIAAFRGEAGGRPVDWLRPASAEALAAGDPLGMGSFPLVPFCNRVREGTFAFGGREVRMPPNFARSRHAIHGHGWRMPWRVERLDRGSGDEGGRVSLALDHEPGDWPFRYAARQDFALDPGGLTVRLSVENRDGTPMPVGLGHHPYFPRTPDARVRARVEAIWSTDAEVMPTALERTPVVDALARGMGVAEAALDNNFTGWDGVAEIRWPERGAALRMTAGEPLRFLVLYTPADEDLFVVEPVGNCTDWLNLMHLGPERVGGGVLAPGESAEAWFRLEPLAGG